VKPVIKTLGCVFYILTLGLIGLVVNALLLMLVGWLSDRSGPAVRRRGLLAAFWARS
jgi:putative membrane protein